MTTAQTLLGPNFYALALQTEVQAINGCSSRDDARLVMAANIERLSKEISASKKFIGPDTRLVVLPEYFLTAYPLGDSIAQWADRACLDMDGSEYDALSRIAQDNDIFLAGNAYELDAHFKGLYFQTSFIIAPNGDIVLRYRRLNSMFAPTPHDVWDKYLDIYGLEGVFPVAKTEIGNLAAIASEEILYPEIARCLAMRGAEIFVHSTGEMGNVSNTPKNICRAARAVENMAYVVSANSGSITGHQLPASATDGRSAIIDYQGRVMVESGWGPTMTAHSQIDLNALRAHRRRPAMGNTLARQRFEAFAQSYAELGSQKANALLDEDGTIRVPERQHFIKTQTQAIADLIKNGVI
jgi:predicted amidohydrolase